MLDEKTLPEMHMEGDAGEGKPSEDATLSMEFDRETGLASLLSQTATAALWKEAAQAGVQSLMVLDMEGAPLALEGRFTREDAGLVFRFIRAGDPEKRRAVKFAGGVAAVFPVIHELLPAGHLVLGWEPVGKQRHSLMMALGGILARALDAMVSSRHKVLMTSGLHGRVVEESHAQLLRQNALLAESRAKYKALAENLEAEVKRQTAKIEETRRLFLQQEKMASIGQLAAGVAHEINNPMGFIASNLASLKEYARDFQKLIRRYQELVRALSPVLEANPSFSTLLEDMAEAEKEMDLDFLMGDVDALISESLDGAGRIKKIIMDLKDFAHPALQEAAECDLNAVLETTLNIARNELKYKADIIKDFGPDARAWCYPQQLCQVFLNLVVNAAQAIGQKGEIRIATRSENGNVIITVRDNGCGIAKEHLSRIFDPFFTTKDVGKGTGLGLNVAYNIVRKHNGTIGAESLEGKGTEFTVTVPKRMKNEE
jgi:signal transduction histidine kinase